MKYDCWTPEERRRYEELQRDRDQRSYEMECAYSVVRQAMTLFPEPDLPRLKNALYLANNLVHEELDQMPDEAQELGLDVWIRTQAEDAALKEQERLDREEWLREQQEELNRLDAQWSQYDSDEA